MGAGDPHGLQAFILSAPRRLGEYDYDYRPSSSSSSTPWIARLQTLWMGFFVANREGILGCIGYCFLHAAGEWVGRSCVFGNHNTNTNKPSKTPLAFPVAALWIAHWILVRFLGATVSRRTTNLTFCLWSLAHNFTLLWGLQAVEAFVSVPSSSSLSLSLSSIVPPSYRAVNNHGMVAFLVANIATGLTNLLLPTLETSDPVAFCILVVYVAFVAGVALAVEHRFSSSPACSSTAARPGKAGPEERTKKTS